MRFFSLLTFIIFALPSLYIYYIKLPTPVSFSKMADEYDYESLGGNTSMAQNAMAGALAGIAEHCAMYPVDSIKVQSRHLVRA